MVADSFVLRSSVVLACAVSKPYDVVATHSLTSWLSLMLADDDVHRRWSMHGLNETCETLQVTSKYVDFFATEVSVFVLFE